MRMKPDILKEFKIPGIMFLSAEQTVKLRLIIWQVFRQTGQSVCHNAVGAILSRALFIAHSRQQFENKIRCFDS